MCNTIKEANTCNESTKRRGTREGPENIFKELMAKNFPNVIYNIHTHTHTPPRSSMKDKGKEKILKTARENQLILY